MENHKSTFRYYEHEQHHDAGKKDNDDEKKKKATISSSSAHILQTPSTGTSGKIIFRNDEHDAGKKDNDDDEKNKKATIFSSMGTCQASIKLSPTEMDNITEPYEKKSIIVFAFGKRFVRSNYLMNRLHTLLSPSEPFQLTELGRGFFLLKAPLLSDFNKLLAKYPWNIPNISLTILQWVPNFRPSEVTITHANVWLRLPELPIEYYGILSQIISVIGDLVKIDPVTKNREKCRFARVCVRLDLNSPLVDEIMIGEIRQRVEYEGLEVVCSQCKRIGHLQQGCPHNSSSTSTTNATASKEILVKSTLHRAAPDKQILTSWNGNSSSDAAEWVQVRYHKNHQRHAYHHPRIISGEKQQPQVQNQNIGTESTPSGSRYQLLENCPEVIDQPNPSKANSDETASVSITSVDHLKVNAEPNNVASIMQLPGGEGTPSSSEINVEKSIQPRTTSSLESTVSPQSSPRAEPKIQLFSKGIQLSVEHQVISSDTPLEEVSAKTAPTVYTIESRIPSLVLGVSRSDTGMEMQDTASFWPTPRDSGASQSGSKKFLLWKYNGAGMSRLSQTMKDLKQLHQPSIVLLTGIKISGDDAVQVIEQIGFSGSHRIDHLGYNGGVWLLWHKEEVEIEVYPSASHRIFAAAHFLPKTSSRMLSGMAIPYNQMQYAVDAANFPSSSSEPLSLSWGTDFFYNSENLANYPSSSSQWVSSY